MSPLIETTRRQRLAAEPERSAFVMANAGSGKTRVLTNRVARLLLAGVKPDKILCITFTKAAAAEMAERLFDVLGGWALADDAKLIGALTDLEGENAPPRSKEELADVRRLFARALETPGGLKIQTIHSFCEQTLKRFPLEAGAPPGFSIIEDAESARLIDEAIDNAAAASVRDKTLAADFARLSLLYNEKDLRNLVRAGVSGRLDFEAAVSRFSGLEGLLAATATELNVNPLEDTEVLKSGFINRLSAADMQRVHEALLASGGNPAKLAPSVKSFLENASLDERWAALSSLFLTTAGAPRKKLVTQATDKADPWAGPYLSDQQAAFVETLDRLKALAIYSNTAAHHRILHTVINRYASAKAARAALDFDDLIARTQRLLRNTDAAWVMYKLDLGIDHVLIDEAQDTSPAQWEVIEALFDEFLSGAGAREEPRSFFAVGDMKQSIYSFQGADAGLFFEKEQALGKRLGAVTHYDSVSLELSFRTVEPVLAFVDALFADQAAAEGLGGSPIPRHACKRAGDAGLVEIWPLTPRPEKPETNPWDAPLDEEAPNHPVRVLSEKIASTVKGWLDEGAMLESQDRPITPGDVMILVQSRGALFDETIHTLARQGVPVAGADRLKLLEDPAVEDLISACKFAIYASDDLSLAEVLKSPLFSFDDDNDLFPLAHDRPKNVSLWASLSKRAEENPHWKDAVRRLKTARAIGLKEGPFAFLTHLLETGAPSGRRLFYERLTEASRDAVDEMLRQALDFEISYPRSLNLFIQWFEKNAGQIKREMERADDAVRVMTVHGAKGLEANIVFLVDAQRGPNVRQLGPVFKLPRNSAEVAGRERLTALAGAAANDTLVTAEAREETKRKAYEEYRRLLYVAATRAKDRLYICGVESGKDKDPRGKETGVKSWHALAEDAFDTFGDRAKTADAPLWADSPHCIRRISCKQTAGIEKKVAAEPPAPVADPDWLFAPAAMEKAPLRLAPSRLADADESDAGPADTPAFSPTGMDKYFRGRVLHRLLELLPELSLNERAAAADRLLEKHAPEIEPEERARWREEVLSVLSSPAFAPVFGPGSRAEVAIAGAPKGAKPGLTVSGQIDRLVVDDRKILVVDYKTNRPPPKNPEDIAPSYLAQMAAYRALLQEIYPAREVACALLWTFEARLTPLPESLLDHAFARYLAPG